MTIRKHQRSANSVRRQLGQLSRKIGKDIHPEYTSRKIGSNIKPKESKPPLVSQQCVLYHFKCDLYDEDYVGYKCRHLYQRTEEHKGSAIGKHVRDLRLVSSVGRAPVCYAGGRGFEP